MYLEGKFITSCEFYSSNHKIIHTHSRKLGTNKRKPQTRLQNIVNQLPPLARLSHQNESLFTIAVSFIGRSATAIRCKLFESITLPSLQLVLKQKPPHSKVVVTVVNDSAMVNPTCAAIMSKAKTALKKNMFFSLPKDIYEVGASARSKYRYFFFSRLDSDDAFSPQALRDLKISFMHTSLTLAVYSPMYITLWYPPTNASYPCGQFIYNRIFR